MDGPSGASSGSIRCSKIFPSSSCRALTRTGFPSSKRPKHSKSQSGWRRWPTRFEGCRLQSFKGSAPPVPISDRLAAENLESRSSRRHQIELVADSHIPCPYAAGGQFDYRMCAWRQSDPPGRQICDDSHRTPIAVDEDDVDRKTHEHGVNRRARRQHQGGRYVEAVPPEESLAAVDA